MRVSVGLAVVLVAGCGSIGSEPNDAAAESSADSAIDSGRRDSGVKDSVADDVADPV